MFGSYLADSFPRITFFTVERAGYFWNIVQSLLFLVMPIVIIWAATVYAGDLIKVIRRTFSAAFTRDEPETYDYKSKIKEE